MTLINLDRWMDGWMDGCMDRFLLKCFGSVSLVCFVLFYLFFIQFNFTCRG